MSEQSKIQWTEATYNPWHGCRKVSAGCKYCFMYRDKERYGQDPTKIVRSKTKFYDPDKWKEPKLIFTCSWSDWFIEDADEWRPEAWEIIKRNPHHTFQILTKRPERIQDHLPQDWGPRGYPNVWLGTSVESQEQVDRIRKLVKNPAAVHFVSYEPALGPLDLQGEYYFVRRDGSYPFSGVPEHGRTKLIDVIDWLIVGGESGNDTGKYLYRPCHVQWIRDIVNQCKEANVPVFVKQLGTHLAKHYHLKDRHGGEIIEWPDSEIQIREFPKKYEFHGPVLPK